MALLLEERLHRNIVPLEVWLLGHSPRFQEGRIVALSALILVEEPHGPGGSAAGAKARR